MPVHTNRPTLNFTPSRELCIDCDEIIEIQELREHKAICGKNHTPPDTGLTVFFTNNYKNTYKRIINI